MRLAYLHGFASGPASTKGLFFQARLAELGVDLELLDLAPDFTRQTVTGMLAVVDAVLAQGPTLLFGSSLGGYLAALAAARSPARVPALVLLAPAFDFADRWRARLGDDAVARWRAARTIPVFHYGHDREEPLAIDLLDDADRYPSEPDPSCPTLAFAGRHDETVPLASVEHFVAGRPARELLVLDSGHELIDVLDPMWARTAAFLRRVCALSP